jgi:hypothetical protein
MQLETVARKLREHTFRLLFNEFEELFAGHIAPRKKGELPNNDRVRTIASQKGVGSANKM